jgi:hypothetical protein
MTISDVGTEMAAAAHLSEMVDGVVLDATGVQGQVSTKCTVSVGTLHMMFPFVLTFL